MEQSDCDVYKAAAACEPAPRAPTAALCPRAGRPYASARAAVFAFRSLSRAGGGALASQLMHPPTAHLPTRPHTHTPRRSRSCPPTPAANKPVFDIEYNSTYADLACKCQSFYGITTILKLTSLAAWRRPCTTAQLATACPYA